MHRRLPVTLVGGFLGAGKTAALHHFISEHQGGHLALLVDAPAKPNLDAKALAGLCGTMGRLHDRVLEIPPGEEPAQLEWLGRTLDELSRDDRFERVFIEVSGTTNPARLADAIAPAELQQIVCVIDALDFFRTAVLPARHGTAPPFLDFQQAQIADATLLVLNKCDLVDESQRIACIEKLSLLNPSAHWTETAYGELPPEVWARAATPHELLAMRERTSKLEPSVGAENPALANTLYRAYRPFHPARFWDWFNAEHPGLLRAKGLVWLATRNLLVGGISRTRCQNGCGGAGVWWAALPREDWPADPAALARMQETWREPYGDRRQEIVLTGEAARLPGIARQLGDCLLSDEEFAASPKAWRALPDPFPAWDVGDEG